MAADSPATPVPWSTPSASEVAEAAGANDLFVFRRIADGRFAHVGGIGRGAGWAGIVEVGVDEPLVEQALASGGVVRRSDAEPRHVLGPYYAHSVVAVSVTPDVFVVFGSEDDRMAEVPDDEFAGLAQFAAEALVEVTPAKRLADEIEALNAVRDLLHAPAETFEEALQRLVDQATASLSCDLGFAYLPERRQLAVCDERDGAGIVDTEAAIATLAGLAEDGTFPVCIQQAEEDDLPAPFSSADDVLAYYVLEITRPVAGVLLLLHTRDGVARGFTLLCQSLGARLVEASEPLLAGALLRDALNADLERAEREARRDALTGLANRLAWKEAVASADATEKCPASVVVVDCRDLKSVNDEYGHGVGDRVLCRVAAALSGAVRTKDLVARLGGDEFALLLHDADESVTRTIVERIETAIEADRQHGQPAVRLAIGAATARDGNLGDAQLRADAEMVAAKRSPRESRRDASA